MTGLAARDVPSQATSPGTASSTSAATSTNTVSSSIPSFSDAAGSSANTTDNNNGNNSPGSLVNYYFVFLALIICIGGLSGFLVWRKRKRALAAMRHSREHALARDLSTWEDGRRREGRTRGYWPGHGRTQEEEAPEEGLNELGEAPPAYVPRKSRESGRVADMTAEPEIPLHTLSREEAGLKPPDYSVTNVEAQPGRLPLGDAFSLVNQSPASGLAKASKKQDNDTFVRKMKTKSVGAPPLKSTTAGTKRKAATTFPLDVDHIDLPTMHVDQNCDQVRRKITKLLDSGETKVGEFCNAIGVSNGAFNRFWGQNGHNEGAGCDAYIGAFEYFKKLDAIGIKLPTKKAKGASASKAGIAEAGNSSTAPHPGISTIHLGGKEDDTVAIYQTWNEIRHKIATHMRNPAAMQVQSCQDLHNQLHSEARPKSIQSQQLNKFRDNDGSKAGNSISVFYAAYCFFEKIWIAEGRPKSEHRVEMEGIWPSAVQRDGHRGGEMHCDVRVIDECGCYSMIKGCPAFVA
ncbi:hypothetical protein LTR62_006746 [Meristemomyces frigidus]|uniref:DUF7726 domain-containing protein n=1 Tax=Meristemomyces frigidus TaxID=1508187 RepID=A0AAN7TNX1_9PEZI|nr:hypothetical protein LTR62_006746 [Meristemomyces frigidus]